MTQAKKLKRAIRARARKTGESYTAARRHMLQKRAEPTPPRAVTSAPSTASTTVAGLNAASVLKKTGHPVDHWFAVLDAFGAASRGHTAAARHLHDDHGVENWYAQSLTVAYERAHGLRAPNQSSAGDFQVSISRVVPASVAEAVDAIRSARRCRRWLSGADPGLARALDVVLAGREPRRVRMKGDSLASLR